MPADDPLEGIDHLGADLQGIDAQMRHGAMAPLADDFEIKPIHGRHEGTVFDANEALGEVGPQMAAEGIVNMGGFHDPLFDHGLGPAGTLFGRLKDELDGAAEAGL